MQYNAALAKTEATEGSWLFDYLGAWISPPKKIPSRHLPSQS